MDADFWHQRWRERRIGFHQDQPAPQLLKHWPSLELARGGRVFVPLAGMSLDLAWLSTQGYAVLGVELSSLAVEEFFVSLGVAPQVHDSRYGRHYRAGNIELICGDVFALDAEVLADCVGVYDRAAMIALPADLRGQYASDLYARLPPGCRGLVITLEYPQHQKQGPPFSVPEAELRQRYQHHWDVQTLERRNILADEPRFAAQGVTTLETVVYRLTRKA